MTCKHINIQLIGKTDHHRTVMWCCACGAHYTSDYGWQLPDNANVTHAPPPAANKSLMWKRIDALSEAFEAQGEKVEDCLKFIEWISEGARVQASRRQERGGDISDD